MKDWEGWKIMREPYHISKTGRFSSQSWKRECIHQLTQRGPLRERERERVAVIIGQRGLTLLPPLLGLLHHLHGAVSERQER